MSEFKAGDLVLATLWKQGSPEDLWCVGFYSGMCGPDRHMVVDNDDQPFRPMGFRGICKIDRACAEYLRANQTDITTSDKTLWWWVRRAMALNSSATRGPKKCAPSPTRR